MTTVVNPSTTWGSRYAKEVENSIDYYNYLNSKQPVRTRQLTEEEMNKIFGSDPDYIKQIEVEDEN